MTKNRRKQLIVNKPFQYKLMGYLAMLATGITAAFAIALGFSRAVVHRSVAQSVAGSGPSLMDMLWLPILVTLILAIIASLFIGLYYSHRIAGPLFNLKRVLNQIENGLIDRPMSIRSKDELHDVQDAVNEMLDGLNSRMANIKKACEKLTDKDKRSLINTINEQFKCRS